MIKKFIYIPIGLLIFFLCLKYSEFSSLGRFRFAPDVVYAKDSEGIFFYNSLKRKTRQIYQCLSQNEAFVHESLIVHNGELIFATYDKHQGQTGDVIHDAIRQYKIIGLDGQGLKPYSNLEFSRGGNMLTLKEDFKLKDVLSVFNELPSEIQILSKLIDNDSQLLCLDHHVNGQCAFVGPLDINSDRSVDGKVIYVWGFAQQSLMPALTFPQKRMPLKDGGGGFVYPSLLTKDQVVFVEIPEQLIPVSMIGIAQFKESYLRILDLPTGQAKTLLKFDSVPEYPRLSLDEKFVIFRERKDNGSETLENNGDLWIREILTGKSIKVATGHSPVWVR